MLRGVALALVVTACSSPSPEALEPRTALERGRDLFENTAEPRPDNAFSCSTCHTASVGGSRVYPGAPMGGVTSRPTYWGGAEVELLRAVNDCRTYFMSAHSSWTTADEDARALYGYLATLPGEPNPIKFTVEQRIDPLPCTANTLSDGQRAFERACASCHGEAHSGLGRLTKKAPVLPDESLRTHATLTPDQVRAVFTEKVRHGNFYGKGGTMPPFSREVLTDPDLAGLLSYLLDAGGCH